MDSKFSKIVLGTDIEDVSQLINSIGLPVEAWYEPVEKPQQFSLDNSSIYVFAYQTIENMLPFMAEKSGNSNVIAFFVRPGTGFLSNDPRLEKITLVSRNSMRIQILSTLTEILER